MSEKRVTQKELEAGLDFVLASPQDQVPLELIVRRPAPGEREIVPSAELDLEVGLVGDNWKARGSSKTSDGLAHPGMQLTLMNVRVITLIAGEKNFWPIAGDQLFVDLDLSAANLPAGTQLQIGSATIEVSPTPHTGCKKFVARFGLEAMKFVSSKAGKVHSLRGINAIVVKPGTVRVGDVVKKLHVS